jgi:hypothetical protein
MKTVKFLHVFLISSLLALIIVAVPATALAATCAQYYTFKAGDKKSEIAHTYGLSWKEIARANNLTVDERPVRGQQLCIPVAKSAVTNPNRTESFVISSSGGAIRLVSTGAVREAVWIVKARDASGGSNYRLGRWRVTTDGTSQASFGIPNDLRDISQLEVCVKNVSTNAHYCNNVFVR